MNAMSKEPGTASEQLKRELNRAIDRIRAELDRIEILSAALGAFSAPVPEYDPGFHHLRHVSANVIELRG